MDSTAHDPLAGLPWADRVNLVTTSDVRDWLRAGWGDVRAAGWVSVGHGMIFVATGFAITGGLVLAGLPYLVTPMIGGFLLVAPLLAMGFYDISRRIEAGERPTFAGALLAWRPNSFHIMTAGLMLMLYLMIWARLAVLIFALFFPYRTMSLDGFLAAAASWDGAMFLGFGALVGFGLAALAFVITVVTLPLMLDQRTDVFSAAFASIMVVARNPRPMALWAVVIAVLVFGAGLLGLVGLAVTLPLVGHASWHAYRALLRS